MFDRTVLQSFAKSCSKAGPEHCALGSLSPSKILHTIDNLIDTLYHEPQPVPGLLRSGAIATAAHVKSRLFGASYRIKNWPALANELSEATKGNYTAVVSAAATREIKAADFLEQDSSLGLFGYMHVTCGDARPYSASHPEPTADDLSDLVLDALEHYSPRVGDGQAMFGFCGRLAQQAKDRYDGPFGMDNGTLHTPILVLSNTYDPVTPLESGKKALARLGSNARLIQQDGFGVSDDNWRFLAIATDMSRLSSIAPWGKPRSVQPRG